MTKINLIEALLEDIKRRAPYQSFNKRSSLRSTMKDDRKRPGWELAYGKKKRSTS